MTDIDFKVESYDVDSTGSMRLSAMQRYIQQAAREDSDKYGATYNALRSDGYVFILIKLNFNITRMPLCEETLHIRTWSDSIDGITFTRGFELSSDGKPSATVISLWALMDYNKRMPVRASMLKYEYPQEKLLPPFTFPRRIEASSVEEAGVRIVRKSDLDQNGHMNNCIYTDVVFDFLPDDIGDSPKEITMIYLSECRLNDKLTVSFSREENTCKAFVMNDTTGKMSYESEIVF